MISVWRSLGHRRADPSSAAPSRRTRLVDLVRGHRQRRQQADRRRARSRSPRGAARAAAGAPRRARRGMSKPSIRPRPRGSRPRLAQARGEPLALVAAPSTRKLVVVHHVEHRVRGRGDHRAAGEGRAVVAGLEHVGVLGRGDAGADRQPAAEALRHRHHVRRHAAACCLAPTSCPVRPMPHWISSKISSAPCSVAGLARGVQHLAVERVDARLALDRLDDHGGGVARRRRRRARPGRRAAPPRSRARAARTAPAWSPAASPTARR